MLIPIRDDNPTSRRAWVTLAIIAANAVVFLFWQPTFASGDTAQVRQEFFFLCHAEIPWEVTHRTSLAEGGASAQRALVEEFGPRTGPAIQRALRVGAPIGGGVTVGNCPHKSWWESVFVAMFLHESWLHIGGNMLFLWVFGNNVEDKIGRLKYLIFYLFCGVVASAAQTVVSPNSGLPSLGASGAIAGVLGAYLVMFPHRRVLSHVPIFFIFSLISLPAVVVLGFWFLLQAFSGATAVASHVAGAGGVAYFAHIGGFAVGVIAAVLFFPKERRPRPEPLGGPLGPGGLGPGPPGW